MLINPRSPCVTPPPGGWPLYSAEAAAALDAAVVAAGRPGFELMDAAAQAAWQLIQQKWPHLQRLSILCGGGNNGGDGLLLACYALAAGVRPRLWLLNDPKTYSREAAQAWQRVQVLGLQPETQALTAEALNADELLVDALLGIGLQGRVRGEAAAWIAALNAASTPVLALDAPSGLEVNTGRLAGVAVKAQVTLSFILLKPGLFTAQGPEQAGEVWLADLGVAPETTPRFSSSPLALLQSPQDAQGALPPRKASGHKGQHGRLLMLAGAADLGGAALLAAQAALRSGVGMLRVWTAPENRTALLARQPEVMVSAWNDLTPSQLEDTLAWADALLIGPGLGQGERAQQLWQAIQTFDKPLVADADALNLWALESLPSLAPRRPWVITPHPGEAARLLGQTLQAVEDNRLAAARELAQRTGSTVVLKGAGSCIQGAVDRPPWVCPFGNAGMGVAGMGDLLAGSLAALLAQGVAPLDAARLAVRCHAQAGDAAAGDQPRGLLPTDLLPFLRQKINAVD